MKFTTTKKDLADALGRVKTLPYPLARNIMSYVLLESINGMVYLTAMSCEVSARVPIEATLDEPGRRLLEGKSLLSLVKDLPAGPVELCSRKDNGADIKSPTGFLGHVEGARPEDYPEPFPALVKCLSIFLPVSVLREAVSKVSFAMSIEEGRPNLIGMHVELDFTTAGDAATSVRFVATDGHRLSLLTTLVESVPEPGSKEAYSRYDLTLHRLGVVALKDFLARSDDNDEVLFVVSEQNALLVMENGRIRCRVIGLDYPEYMRALAKDYPTSLIVERKSLIVAVRAAARFASTLSHTAPVRLVQVREAVRLIVGSDAEAPDWQWVLPATWICRPKEEEVPPATETETKTSSKPVTTGAIGCNPGYLLDAIERLNGVYAVIEIPSLISAPARITAQHDEKIVHHVMPIRI